MENANLVIRRSGRQILKAGIAGSILLVVGVATLLLKAQQPTKNSTSNAENPDCTAESVSEICQVPGTIILTNANATSNVCLGATVDASASQVVLTGLVVLVTHYTNSAGQASTNCPDTSTTNTVSPSVVSNWWTVAGPGSYSNSGSGLSASFNPTNCGTGRITFNLAYRNATPCNTNLQYATPASADFTVIKIAITPASTNGLINHCQTNSSVTFSLTSDSCPLGDVSWSIAPSGLANGAAISGSGNSASVAIGDLVTNYTITATPVANPACAATATLSVGRDCNCTNHLIALSFGDEDPPKPCEPNENWVYPPFATTECGGTLVWSCDGEMHVQLDSTEVAHCPWPQTTGWFRYWKCKCNSVFKKTDFKLICTKETSEYYGRGKRTIWMCPECQTPTNTCFTVDPVPNGNETGRPCDEDDM